MWALVGLVVLLAVVVGGLLFYKYVIAPDTASGSGPVVKGDSQKAGESQTPEKEEAEQVSEEK